MTRDEHREKCIDKMRDAFFEMQRALGYTPQRDHPDPRICMIAAFDALHGIARVHPSEETDEMIAADSLFMPRLTNPPETKP